jgi:NADPH-dependent ferric siderophore reductase
MKKEDDMTDLSLLPLPEALHDGPLAGTHRWTFVVVGAEDLTPDLRRLRLAAPQLERLQPAPGQDLMIAVPTGAAGEDGIVPTINRRYSIRSVDRASGSPQVVVDVVTHGSGPGARWASAAAVGDRVTAVGPRGKIVPVTDASAHLFVADAAGAPASLSMLESLPRGTGHALLVVETPDQLQPTTAPDGSVTWLVGADPTEIEAAVSTALQSETARSGVQVYLAGERSQVARWRTVVRSAGVADEQVKWKAYWSQDAANAPHGEPAREA